MINKRQEAVIKIMDHLTTYVRFGSKLDNTVEHEISMKTSQPLETLLWINVITPIHDAVRAQYGGY